MRIYCGRRLWMLMAVGLSQQVLATTPLSVSTWLNAQTLDSGAAGYRIYPNAWPETVGYVDPAVIVINTQIVHATSLYGMGIWGQNVISANVEGGLIWNGHEALGKVDGYVYHAESVSGQTGQLDFDKHATAVGHVLAGDTGADNPFWYQVGIAPSSTLFSGGIATTWNPDGSFDTSANSFMYPYRYLIETLQADVINSSFGYVDSAGNDDSTRGVDALLNAHPKTTLVVAAGNATNINTVGGPASGYNAIAVGAQAWAQGMYTTTADFSSRGPQDYWDPVHGVIQGVRAPVHLVAPGENIAAAALVKSDLSNTNSYYILDGTSFAAPIVAGGVALLQSYSKAIENNAGGAGWWSDQARDHRVIKAVLINSADKPAEWDNGLRISESMGYLVTTQSLDWATGGGMLNLDRAVDTYGGWTGGWLGPTNTISSGQLLTLALPSFPNTNGWLNVTMAWDRETSITFGESAGDFTVEELGFADLNLYVGYTDGLTLSPLAASMSRYNNVEHLHVPIETFTAGTSNVVVAIHHNDMVFGEDTPTGFSLVYEFQPVPEPSTGTLILLAAGVAALMRRRI